MKPVKCLRCNRPLKLNKSIKLGYGKKYHELVFGINKIKKRKIKGYFYGKFNKKRKNI